MDKATLTIIGGGLAGVEAAYQAAEQGAEVTLFEMRPLTNTAAHKTDRLAELVCSNSLGSSDPANAAGLLKEEMRRLGSLVLSVAEEVRIPAGSALAVDREEFSRALTKTIENHPQIRLVREEIKAIPQSGVVIIATGPLTSDALAAEIKALTRSEHLYFYDAISPIIDADSIDREKVFLASRYDKGGADYINCPMTREEYEIFHAALNQAQRVPFKEFERANYFEGCTPIEVMAERGKETLAFGPMKPVGLVDPRTQTQPHAVVQLRQENQFASCYNMVGFQTKLTWPEQRRVFRMIPGLERAEFLRYGSLHRNTFINAPLLLGKTLQLRVNPRILFAGQMVGVEGYLESAAMGWLAGINAVRILRGESGIFPPPTTAHGALLKYLTESSPTNFQPMNINFGLLPSPENPIRDRDLRRKSMIERALEDLVRWKKQYKLS
jgi:methylenetetrahydrofolate--tRNA-(uracil-5-)-methyltransferase